MPSKVLVVVASLAVGLLLSPEAAEGSSLTNDLLHGIAGRAASLKCGFRGFKGVKGSSRPEDQSVLYRGKETAARQGRNDIQDHMPRLIDVEYWADQICRHPDKQLNPKVNAFSSDASWLSENPRFAQLATAIASNAPMAASDPYAQKVRDTAEGGDLTHILPGMVYVRETDIPVLKRNGIPVPKPYKYVRGASRPSADDPVTQSAGDGQSERVQFTATSAEDGASYPTAVALAAEQAMTLQGKQQDLAERQAALAGEEMMLEDAVGARAGFGNRELGILLIGFSFGLVVMYIGYDKVHSGVEAMGGYPGPSRNAVTAARAAHALD